MTPVELFDDDLTSRVPDGLLGAVEWYREQLQGPLEVAEALLGECDSLGSASTEAAEVVPLVARVLAHLDQSRVWAASFAASAHSPGRSHQGRHDRGSAGER